jgi:polyketide synthase 5
MSQSRLPLAIVGIGCRIPGGIRRLDQLWQLISAGKDGVREIPADRRDWRRYYEERDAAGKRYVRTGAFLDEDITKLDAEFFGIWFQRYNQFFARSARLKFERAVSRIEPHDVAAEH